jgi:hypothetical protein
MVTCEKLPSAVLQDNHRNLNGQQRSVDSIDVDHTSYTILPKVLPEIDVILELVWVASAVRIDVIPGSFLDVDRVCLLERYREKIGHA